MDRAFAGRLRDILAAPRAGGLSGPLERPLADIRRADAERSGLSARPTNSGFEGPEDAGLSGRAFRHAGRASVRRPLVGQGDALAAAFEGRVPGLRARKGSGPLLHPDPGPAPDISRSESAGGTPHVLPGGPDHGRELERMDASRRGSFPRAHGFREGSPDASVRERVLRPHGPSRLLPERLTSPSPFPLPPGEGGGSPTVTSKKRDSSDDEGV